MDFSRSGLTEMTDAELRDTEGGLDWNGVGGAIATAGGAAAGAKIGAGIGILGGPVGSAVGGIVGGAVGYAVYSFWDR